MSRIRDETVCIDTSDIGYDMLDELYDIASVSNGRVDIIEGGDKICTSLGDFPILMRAIADSPSFSDADRFLLDANKEFSNKVVDKLSQLEYRVSDLEGYPDDAVRPDEIELE